jgi:hypothetical protein
MALFSIGWLSVYSEESYWSDAEPGEWVRVEADSENAPITRVIADDYDVAWATDWLNDARRAGETPSPRWLAVRFGSGATLREIEQPITPAELTRPQRSPRA